MTDKAKIDILDAYDIKHQVTSGGKLEALYTMRDWKGNDCSEWIDIDEMIKIIDDPEH